MRKQIFSLLNDLLGLFYPKLCLACSKNLSIQEKYLCPVCEYQLPQTKFHLEKENPFTKRFWGRIPLQEGAAFYHFSKGSLTQQLVHKFKYEGKSRVGISLGLTYGHILKEAGTFQDVDIILPVPLHFKKEIQRGYNQSDKFAEGLSSSLNIPWLKDGLERTSHTPSQTQKSRMERFENVEQAFRVKRPKKIKGKHVLIVDDVLTTGATLEACALKILEVPETRVSLATLAFANY